MDDLIESDLELRICEFFRNQSLEAFNTFINLGNK